jgi:hypothetical protein
MGLFQGFVQQEQSIPITVLVKTAANVPVNSDALPTARVYGPQGVMASGAVTLAFKDTNTIQGATNASPIVVTSANHGLSTGARVTITGVAGNLGANGTWVVTVIDNNTFSLTGSVGNGAYTSGGVWNTTGLYSLTVSATGANGYAAGNTYSVLVSAALSTVGWADLNNFSVT